MNKIMKSLYFKLNEENPKHQAIIRFFDKVKDRGMNKIDVLYYLVRMEEAASKTCYIEKCVSNAAEFHKNINKE